MTITSRFWKKLRQIFKSGCFWKFSWRRNTSGKLFSQNFINATQKYQLLALRFTWREKEINNFLFSIFSYDVRSYFGFVDFNNSFLSSNLENSLYIYRVTTKIMLKVNSYISRLHLILAVNYSSWLIRDTWDTSIFLDCYTNQFTKVSGWIHFEEKYFSSSISTVKTKTILKLYRTFRSKYGSKKVSSGTLRKLDQIKFNLSPWNCVIIFTHYIAYLRSCRSKEMRISKKFLFYVRSRRTRDMFESIHRKYTAIEWLS